MNCGLYVIYNEDSEIENIAKILDLPFLGGNCRHLIK